MIDVLRGKGHRLNKCRRISVRLSNNRFLKFSFYELKMVEVMLKVDITDVQWRKIQLVSKSMRNDVKLYLIVVSDYYK